MGRVITNVGLGALANRIKGITSEPLFIGYGTGSSRANYADTILSDEPWGIGDYNRLVGESSVLGNIYSVTGTFSPSIETVITNWGLFNNENQLIAKESITTGYTISIGGSFTVNFQFTITGGSV